MLCDPGWSGLHTALGARHHGRDRLADAAADFAPDDALRPADTTAHLAHGTTGAPLHAANLAADLAHCSATATTGLADGSLDTALRYPLLPTDDALALADRSLRLSLRSPANHRRPPCGVGPSAAAQSSRGRRRERMPDALRDRLARPLQTYTRRRRMQRKRARNIASRVTVDASTDRRAPRIPARNRPCVRRLYMPRSTTVPSERVLEWARTCTYEGCATRSRRAGGTRPPRAPHDRAESTWRGGSCIT